MNGALAILREDLMNHPCASLILAAHYVADQLGNEMAPDWIKVMTEGNPEYWQDLIAAANYLVKAEEMQ